MSQHSQTIYPNLLPISRRRRHLSRHQRTDQLDSKIPSSSQSEPSIPVTQDRPASSDPTRGGPKFPLVEQL